MMSASDAAHARTRNESMLRWLLSAPALVILLVAAIAPLSIIFVYSFLAPGSYGGVTWKFSTDAWFGVLFQRDIFADTVSFADANLAIFWRSVQLSVITTVLTLLVGFPTAFSIATCSKRWREILLFLITIPFWTNLLIRTFALQEVIRNEGVINTALLKMGLISHPISMMYTDFAVGLGMTYAFLPLMVLPLYASIERLDFRILEAGYDLYASRWDVLLRLIIPLNMPGIIAGSILVFIPSLGAYVTPRLLGGGKSLMLGNLIELQFGQGRNWPLGSSLSITMMAIVMLALLLYVRNARRESGRHG